MKGYSSDKIRNIALVGHGGCGKTTFIESLLLQTGVINRMGKIEDGNTVSDYDKMEKEKGYSINTSVIPILWKDTKINFVDTPGFFDYVGEVNAAMRAVEAAGLFNQNGSLSQSQGLNRLVLIVVVVDQVGMEVGRCQDTNIDSLSLHGLSILSSGDIASHSHQSISISTGIFWGNSRARIRALCCHSSFSRTCSSRWFCFRHAAFYWSRISSDRWKIGRAHV